MREATVVRAGGGVVCQCCAIAETFPTRLRGLLGRRGLGEGEGLLIRPANSVHMFFMRFAIDVAFLDGDLRVLKVVAGLRPWRMAGCRGAKAALELPAGAAAARNVAAGEQLLTEPLHG